MVRDYFAAFDTADPDRIAAHVSEGFVNDHTAALGTGCTGRAAYRERLPGFLASMPGLHYELDHVIAQGGDVAVFYTMTGRWQGDAPFTVRGAMRLRVVDGAITERSDHWDSAVFLRQVDPAAATTLAGLGLA